MTESQSSLAWRKRFFSSLWLVVLLLVSCSRSVVDCFVVPTTPSATALGNHDGDTTISSRLYSQPPPPQPPRNNKKRKTTKPSRFVQTAHDAGPANAYKTSSNGKDNNGPQTHEPSRRRSSPSNPVSQQSTTTAAAPSSKIDKDKMWRRNNQSVEDLEDVLTKRWGDGDDHGAALSRPRHGAAKTTTTTKNNAMVARPVLDPWAKSSDDSHSQSRRFASDDDDDRPIFGSSRRKSPLSVDHLIARQPAGGRGTLRDDDDNDDETDIEEQSFFFQAPRIDAMTTTPVARSRGVAPSTEPKRTATPKPTESAPNRRRSAQKPVVKVSPLVDDDGHAMYLTTQQAMRHFKKSVVSGSEDQDQSADLAAEEATMSWQQLGITNSRLVQNLYDMSCMTPLAVQTKSIPAIMNINQDVLIGTYTGSGKTLAILTPLIERVLQQVSTGDDTSSSEELKAIIVAPGRELASQIVAVARELLKETGLTVMMAIGGTTSSRNVEQIRKRKPSFLVGTPGRLAELIVGRPGEKSGRVKTTDLQTIVLDEFDALLQYDAHAEPTNALMQNLKRRHGANLQTVLCSATACDMVNSPKLQFFLREGFQSANTDQDDKLVTGGDGRTRVSKTVLHGVVHVPRQRLALDALRRILHTDPIPQQILVFVENSRKVDIVVEKLENMGIIAAPLHGGRGSEKSDRAEVSKALREGYVGLVVATELAARGLDAPLLTHVINFDLPTDASHYAHRAGRCGRGGRPGVVLNMTIGPKERNVPKKFADQLGVEMHRVEIANSRLNIIDADTPIQDQ